MNKTVVLLALGSFAFLSCSTTRMAKSIEFPLEYYVPSLKPSLSNEFGSAMDRSNCQMRTAALDSIQEVFLRQILAYADRTLPITKSETDEDRVIKLPEYVSRLISRGVPCIEIQSASAVALLPVLARDIPIAVWTRNEVVVNGCVLSFDALDMVVGYKYEISPGTVTFYFHSGFHARTAFDAMVHDSRYSPILPAAGAESMRVVRAAFAITGAEASTLNSATQKDLANLCQLCAPAKLVNE